MFPLQKNKYVVTKTKDMYPNACSTFNTHLVGLQWTQRNALKTS